VGEEHGVGIEALQFSAPQFEVVGLTVRGLAQFVWMEYEHIHAYALWIGIATRLDAKVSCDQFHCTRDCAELKLFSFD